MGLDVAVDPELCVGSGDCVRIAPTAFALDDDQTVSRPTPGAAGTVLEVLREAARSCPTQAIRLTHDGAALGEPGDDRRSGSPAR